MNQRQALRLAEAVADLLHHPQTVSQYVPRDTWHPQSLATGAPGIALLHIELAALGIRSWRRVHDWLTSAQHYVTGPHSNPFYGAPAYAHAMAAAARVNPNTYQRALSKLDDSIESAVRLRLDAAHRRLDTAQPPVPAEFDTIRGLTGYGAYLMHRMPHGDILQAILRYLVRLTEPITVAGHIVPGWWCHGPPTTRLDGRFPHGHSNHGVAHGIGGPLALLSLATIRGIHVDGQEAATRTICAWLDTWQTESAVTSWPYWINLTELHQQQADRPAQRPSWCYGTAGLGRALQLAAIATRDPGRRQHVETAVADTLTDQTALEVTTDASLCHGFAGLAHLAHVVAADATPLAARRLRTRIPSLLHRIHNPRTDPHTAARKLAASAAGPGLLDGAAGTALAALSTTVAAPQSGWDTCLLIT